MAGAEAVRGETAGAASPLASGRARLLSEAVVRLAVFVGVFALLLPPCLFGIEVFDEGFIVTGAMHVLAGRLPYRDFTSLYGPAQFYLLAGTFALFGERLIVAHIAHAVVLAALALLIFVLTRVATPESRATPFVTTAAFVGLALYAHPSVLYPAILATLALLLAALTVGKWQLERRSSMLGATSAFIGFAGILRWDFGAFGLIALAVILAASSKRAQSSQRNSRVVVAALGPALGIMAVVYIPLLLLSDPLRWYQEAFLYSIFEFAKWRRLEYVRPALWTLLGAWRDGDANAFARAFLELSYVAVPFALALVTLARTGLRLVQGDESARDRAFAQSLFLSVVTLFLLNQMRIRPHPWQGFPAAVACLPLIPYAFGAKPGARLESAIRITATVAGLVIAAFLFRPAFEQWMHAIDRRAIPLDTPRASGIRVDREKSDYAGLVNYIRTHTRDGEPVYSGAADHSRLFVNDPMLYFLSGRPAADRFVELEPGIANTQSAQQEIMKSLRSGSVRLVVLWNITSNEPNLTSTSNGIRDLDAYIGEHYREHAKFGPYTVRVRDATATAVPAQ